MCGAWSQRTGIPTVVLRPVLVLTDERLATLRPDDVELGSFVHVDDVAEAVVRALAVDLADADRHVRMTLCGPGPFATSVARRVLGWRPTRAWPGDRGPSSRPGRA